MADEQTGDDADRRAEAALRSDELWVGCEPAHWRAAVARIAAAIREAVAAERERCVAVLRDIAMPGIGTLLARIREAKS